MPVRTLTVVIAALLAGAAGAAGVYTELRHAPELAAAHSEERSVPVEPSRLAALVTDEQRDWSWPQPTEMGKAAMTIALSLVDGSVAAPGSYDTAAAESIAVEVIVHHLADDPTDANAWFRLALLEAREGDVESAAAHLALSRRLAPGEGWIVENRVRFELLSASAGLNALTPTLAADLATFVAWASPDEVRDLMATSDAVSRTRIEQAISTLPPRRTEILRRAGVPLTTTNHGDG
jgi:hypothetical protein